MHAACLFKRQASTIYPVLTLPEGSGPDIDIDYMLLNAFPKTSTNEDHYYEFTTPNKFCFTYVFDRTNSIVVSTSSHVSSEFFELIKNAMSSLADATPVDKLKVVWSSMMFYINNTEGLHDFSMFPKKTNFLRIWKALFTSGGIYITAPNPEILTKAVDAILSLASPFKYTDPILMTFNQKDKRLCDISGYNIVATTNDIHINKNRKFAFEIHTKNIHQKHQVDVIAELRNRSSRLMKLTKFILDDNLLQNPYSDILEYPFVTDDIVKELGSEGTEDQWLAQDMLNFEQTQTLKDWRKSISFREQFRDAVLSMSPSTVLRLNSKQHLRFLFRKLKEIKSRYNKDSHMKTVIRKTRKVIYHYFEECKLNHDISFDEEGLSAISSYSYDDLAAAAGKSIHYDDSDLVAQFSPED